MGFLFSRNDNPPPQPPPKNYAQSQIQNVDVVKMRLKKTRDTIKTFISKKNKDIAQLDA